MMHILENTLYGSHYTTRSVIIERGCTVQISTSTSGCSFLLQWMDINRFHSRAMPLCSQFQYYVLYFFYRSCSIKQQWSMTTPCCANFKVWIIFFLDLIEKWKTNKSFHYYFFHIILSSVFYRVQWGFKSYVLYSNVCHRLIGKN